MVIAVETAAITDIYFLPVSLIKHFKCFPIAVGLESSETNKRYLNILVIHPISFIANALVTYSGDSRFTLGAEIVMT